MELPLLQKILTENNIPKFRYQQIVDAYFSKPIVSWGEVKGLGKDLVALLESKIPFCSISYKDHTTTADVVKYVFTLTSGNLIEAVVMKHDDGRRTLCLSCQSGCPMGCYFCATGTMGLKKNLTASEIVDTAREVNRILQTEYNETLTNVVYMGMGEPFANYSAVKESLHMLHDLMGFGWRRLSVSTCGIVPKILEFAKDFPQVNLAISLHAATNEKRSKMMPINDTFPLEKLMKACEAYVVTTRRKIFFEYLVIDGFNDTLEDVHELKKVLNHPLYHLNLIRFHATDATQSAYGITWKAPTKARLDAFMSEIKRAKIAFTLRRSFGERVDAACGMLALKNK